jgi:hypothetical protein
LEYALPETRRNNGAAANRIQILACGFLLAVLWMDLKFDLLLLPHLRAGEPAPQETLDSIAAYYRRALAAERNTFMLIVTMMTIGLAACIWQGLRAAAVPRWMRAASGVLYAPPVLLAVLRIVPVARRLGAQETDIETQRAMAREVCLSHAYCFVSMLSCGVLLVVIGYILDRRSTPS